MPKKQKTHFHPKFIFALSLAAVFFTGTLLLSLKPHKDPVALLTESIHSASLTADLSGLPAMTDDVNLYNEGNLLSVESGVARITHADGLSDDVKTQSPLVAGDRISVNTDANAEILWFDGSIARLAAGTDVTILKASFDSANPNKTHIALWAERGKIWAKVARLIDGASEFMIESTSAIAGVRGTTFHYLLEDALPKVEVIEGTVLLTKTAQTLAGETSIALTSGQTGSLKSDGTMERQTLDPKKLKEPYYAQQLEKDFLENQKFRDANLQKIRQWASPLPGDPGYPEKQQAIQTALSQATDPLLLDTLKARAAKIKIYEAISLSDPANVQTTLKEVSDKIQKNEWPEVRTEGSQIDLKNNLKHLERALSPADKEDDRRSDETPTPSREERTPIEIQAKPSGEVEKKVPSKRLSEPAKSPIRLKQPPVLEAPKSESSEEPDELGAGSLELREQESKGQASHPSILPTENELPSPTLPPEIKHELVLEKIQTNREGWVKRVEEKRQKEIEKEDSIPKESNDGKDNKPIEKTGQETPATPEEKEATETIAPLENNAPQAPIADELPGEPSATPENPTTENLQTEPLPDQGTEDIIEAPKKPKEDNGHGTSESDTPNENRGRTLPPGLIDN